MHLQRSTAAEITMVFFSVSLPFSLRLDPTAAGEIFLCTIREFTALKNHRRGEMLLLHQTQQSSCRLLYEQDTCHLYVFYIRDAVIFGCLVNLTIRFGKQQTTAFQPVTKPVETKSKLVHPLNSRDQCCAAFK